MLTAICEIQLGGAAAISDWVREVLDAVAHSLARWDDAGTPRGLAGADIALPARISDVARR